MPQVIFSTPTLGRHLCVEYVQSAFATQHLVQRAGWDQAWRMIGGDPYLPKVRNRLVSEFLDRFPDATDLFFIDDDMGWDPESVVRMLEHPADFVVGVYPKKADKTEFPTELCLDKGGEFIWKDGLVEVALAPTGFMRLRRTVLQQMADASGVFMDPDAEGNDVRCWDIFRDGFIPNPEDEKTGKWWGEDYHFSARWRYEFGGQIWCDPNILFTHRGQKVWAAVFDHSIKLTADKIREERENAKRRYED